MESPKLNLLNMPDEIILRILQYAGPSIFAHEPNMVVQNVRLTCRSLHNIASELLVPQLHVSAQLSSMEHFDAVSRHPLIRKGVKSVIVNAAVYRRKLATDFETFLRDVYGDISEKVDDLKGYLKSLYGGSRLFFETAIAVQHKNAEGRAALEKLKKIARSVGRIEWGYSSRGLPINHISALLLRAHLEYQRRYEFQQILLRNGAFSKVISEACARMSTMQTVTICDHRKSVFEFRQKYIEIAESEDELLAFLVLPSLWEQIGKDEFDYDDLVNDDFFKGVSQLVKKLPAAILSANTTITTLNIRLSPSNNILLFATDEDERRILQAAAQNLRHFDFTSRSRYTRPEFPRFPVEVETIRDYLCLFINSEYIETMELGFEILWDRDHLPSYSLGQVLNLRPWPRLKEFHLTAVSLHLTELKQLMDSLPRPFPNMSILTMQLLSGSWAEALDIMRGPSGNALDFGEPFGAECDTMQEEIKEHIFGVGAGYYRDFEGNCSIAAAYIKGWIDENPMKVPDEEHLREMAEMAAMAAMAARDQRERGTEISDTNDDESSEDEEISDDEESSEDEETLEGEESMEDEESLEDEESTVEDEESSDSSSSSG